jgi:hypothetical protein
VEGIGKRSEYALGVALEVTGLGFKATPRHHTTGNSPVLLDLLRFKGYMCNAKLGRFAL